MIAADPLCLSGGIGHLLTEHNETHQILLVLTEKYTDFTELTPSMIAEFVDRIEVYAPYKDEFGERCQNVDLFLKFMTSVPRPRAVDIITAHRYNDMEGSDRI